MGESKHVIATDLNKFDAHQIAPEEYDDIPEWTDEMFDKATFCIGGLPVALPPRRGRPRAEHPKVHTRLRIDPDVLEHFKAGGPGWQTRINAALREAMAK